MGTDSTGPSSDLRVPVLCPLTGERMWVRISGPSEEDRFRVLACERFPGGEIRCGVECADFAIPAVCRLRSTVYRPSSVPEATSSAAKSGQPRARPPGGDRPTTRREGLR